MSPTLLRPVFSLTRSLVALVLFCGLTLAAQAVPAAPTALRGVVTASGAITLLWDDNATDETHFQISYTANNVAQTPLTLTTGNSAGTGLTGTSGRRP